MAFLTYIDDHPIISYTASLYTLNGFWESFGGICFPRELIPDLKGEHRLSKRDCGVLVKWLGRDCGVIITDGEVGAALLSQALYPHKSHILQSHTLLLCEFHKELG